MANISVSVKRMQKTNGVDYFVNIECEGREVTPHVFSERYKAEYEVAHYSWIFGLRDTKPYILDYDEKTYPNN